jgi:hypothetical protein
MSCEILEIRPIEGQRWVHRKERGPMGEGQSRTKAGMDMNVFSRMRAKTLVVLRLTRSMATAPPSDWPNTICGTALVGYWLSVERED